MEFVNVRDRNQQTARVSQIVIMVMLAMFVFILVVALNNDSWHWYALSGILGFILASGVLAFYWSQNDRATWGAWLILGSIIGGILATSLLYTGIGMSMGLLSVFLVWQIANVTLPISYASRAVFWGVLFTIVTILVDLFGPSYRFVFPELVNTLNILAFVMILIFGALVLRNYRQYAVQTKLVSIALFIILLIVSSTTLLTGQAIQNTLRTEIGNDLQVVAQAQAFAVSELLGRQVNALEVLSLDQSIQTAVIAQADDLSPNPETAVQQLIAEDADWQTAADESSLVRSRQENAAAVTLLRFQTRFPDNTQLFVTDKFGGLVATTSRSASYYQGDESWWRETFAAAEGATYISDLSASENGIGYELKIAIPLYQATNDEFIGTLHTTYQLRELLELLRESRRMGEFGEVALVLGDQKLSFVDGGFQLVAHGLDMETVTALRESDERFVQADHLDPPQFLSMAPVDTLSHVAAVDRLDWSVLVNQLESDALFPVMVQQRITMLLGILLAIIGGIVAAYAGRLLSEPIARLTETAVRVRNGDLSARATVEANDEVGILAETFNSMTSQLQASLQHLDFRVRERTRALEVAASIGRRIATILDQEELITAVVDQVQKAFNYYHVHIYILDRSNNRLMMVNGTGQAGLSMRKYGHFINLGEGLVGRAAATNITILTPDVTRDPRWVPNKWLPETKSELAVPIATEQEVLGVLDVQRTTAGSLTEADANVLQLVANQVAIALQNARLYAFTQQRADRQSRINSIGQQIQGTSSIEQAMKVAVRELGRALDMDYARVYLDLGIEENGNNKQEP